MMRENREKIFLAAGILFCILAAAAIIFGVRDYFNLGESDKEAGELTVRKDGINANPYCDEERKQENV